MYRSSFVELAATPRSSRGDKTGFAQPHLLRSILSVTSPLDYLIASD